MKVLLVHNEYQQPGGEDVVFRQEAELLSRFGHRVLTYIRSNHEIRGASVSERLRQVKQLVWAEDTQQDLAKVLADVNPDIVHVHNTFMQVSPSVYAVCRRFGVPVVQTLHNFRLLCPAATFYRDGHVCEDCMTHSLWRSIEHGCYRNSRGATAAVAMMLTAHRSVHTWKENIDSYISLTEFARQKFIRGGFPAGSIFVKPNFVHPDPGDDHQKDSYAIFVGRLSAEKGLRTLLRAWSYLKSSVQLRIVGDGPLRSELEDIVSSNNLSNVSFLGRLPRSETQGAIKGARFLVLPSECYENFPMTIVEAFASGTPVICSGFGSMQEIVKHRRTGLHFEPKSGEDLAEKVAWLWAYPERMKAMGDEARREYEFRYSAERNYALLMEIYQQTLHRGSIPARECDLHTYPSQPLQL